MRAILLPSTQGDNTGPATTLSPELREMQGIQYILQFESLLGRLTAPTPAPDNQLDAMLNSTSQYELLRWLYSQNVSLGNTVIEEHMSKHPLALERQQLLFSVQPGIVPFLSSITMDNEHPFKNLDEYLKIVHLLNVEFPKATATTEEVMKWSRDLDLALVFFLDCTLICALEALEHKEIVGRSKMLFRLDQAMFGKDLIFSQQLIRSLRLGLTTDTLGSPVGNIRLHGVMSPDQQPFILEMVKTYMFFLARKITIMANVVLHPTFTVGLVNLVSNIALCPDVNIMFDYHGDPNNNTPEIGIDFNDLVPIVCLKSDCMRKVTCEFAKYEPQYYYIKVGTVELGEPTLGAKKTVNFESMRNSYVMRAKTGNAHASVIFDPLEKPAKRKFRKRRGTQVDNRMVWDERYLRHVAREYKKMSEEDDFMMEAHRAQSLAMPDPNTEVNLLETHTYKPLCKPRLFLPVIYQIL